MTRTPKARALGTALRNVREDQGFKLRDLARQIGRDPGVVSRWETGERTPKPEQVAQMLAAMGINGERYDEILSLAYDPDASLWVATTLPAQRQQLSAFVDCEQNAKYITEVSPLLVPGLLQTGDYIRAIMSGGGVPASEIATRVAIRIGRREVLTRSDPVNFVALVGEGVLRQVVGGREALIEQLRHLIAVCRRSNVEFRIIPRASGWNPSLEGAFTILEPREGTPVVHLENRRSGLFLHEDDDVDAYRRAADRIHQVSLSAQESVRLVGDLVKRMEAST